MKVIIIEAVPGWAASYIANNEPGDLMDDDIKLVDNFIQKLRKKEIYITCPADTIEYWASHPAFGLPCMVDD